MRFKFCLTGINPLLNSFLILTYATFPTQPSYAEVRSDKPSSTQTEELLSAARGAIAAQKFQDVPKIWLLRNTWNSLQPTVYPQDLELASAMWLAIARLNLCPQGLPADAHGLWTIATHNYVLRNVMPREDDEVQPPFERFASAEQVRKISWSDVLSPEELANLQFGAMGCNVVRTAIRESKLSSETRSEGLANRANTAVILRRFLKLAQKELKNVRATSVVDSRIFDLSLYLSSRDKTDPEAVAILKKAAMWSVDDWLALTPQRRLFLYRRLFERNDNKVPSEETLLRIIDAVISQKLGAELVSWIGFLSHEAPKEKLSLIWSGERGERVLSLDATTGFRGRGAIALRRGVGFLEVGDLHQALLSMAFALRYVDESEPSAQVVTSLARRWISFVAGTWETDTALIAVLKEVLPREEVTPVFEDLAWRAAFRADKKSFDLTASSLRNRGAAAARIGLLESLAKGEVSKFIVTVEKRLIQEPYSSLRFCQSLLDRIESEDAAIRTRLAPALQMLATTGFAQARAERPLRGLIEVAKRAEQILRSQSNKSELSRDERARQFASTNGVFVGSVRLAPSDPLPWPFDLPNPKPPQVFVPIQALPERWNEEKRVVTGWRLVE